LDHADRRIRRYILAKQGLIKLLEEQKQAIMHQAVTRGLDPNVRLKPSGVEWLGDVPEHWELVQLRRSVKRGTTITYGIVQAGPDIEGGVPYIRTSDMRGSSLPETGYLRTSTKIDKSYARSKVEENDLVVAIRATLGKGLLVPDFLAGANLTQGTARVAPGEMLLPRFLFAAFNSAYCQEQIRLAAKGTTYLEITLEALRRICIAVPPLDEQRTITEYTDRATTDLDSTVMRTQREISLMREYRTRLVADVVTGKLDVREAAAGLPDESDEHEEPELLEEAGELADEEVAVEDAEEAAQEVMV
jgi:type I restriction enzyme, S subunit